jgi:hypothetical protein
MDTVPVALHTGKGESASNPLLEAALEHAEQGWRILPIKSRDKTPLIRQWPQRASSDAGTIRDWAARHPGCNWGVACGPGSGVWVLDIDGHKGRMSLTALETQHGRLPVTLVSRTGREDGGEHRYFSYPEDVALRNSALGEGLDVRGDGGCVIVPPSVHRSGRAYKWVDPGATIAGAPPWAVGNGR